MEEFDIGVFHYMDKCYTKFNGYSRTHFNLLFSKGSVLVSYGVPVVIKTLHGTYLTKDWNYSVTTLQYVKRFLNLNKKEIEQKLSNGEFKMIRYIDMNKGKYVVV